MTMASFTVDIIISTFFFILTMYGSIMGGSGQVTITEKIDIANTMGVVPQADREADQ